jgi:hypothetical protein
MLKRIPFSGEFAEAGSSIEWCVLRLGMALIKARSSARGEACGIKYRRVEGNRFRS